LQPIDDKENEEASLYLKRSVPKKQSGGTLKGRNASMGGYNSQQSLYPRTTRGNQLIDDFVMVKDPRVELSHHVDERYFMHHKVVLLGDSGVGKSSLFANFIKEL
jgi:hypothetical protein